MKFALVLLALVAVSHARPYESLEAELRRGPLDIMIIMKDQTSQVRRRIQTQNFVNTNAKVQVLYSELKAFTAESQKDVLSFLSTQRAAGVKGFYLTNRISVRSATLELLTALQQNEKLMSQIQEIRAAKVLSLPELQPVDESIEPKVLEWGVAKINAPQAWETATGDKVVVSNIDTGVRFTHNALRDAYRAEYGWFDPYQGTETPNDQNGHGSHTMGSITGRNGTGTGFGTGVAPGAQFVACKGCSTSECTEEALLRCGEWTFCPTLYDGTMPNCDMRPHVSSNSWGGGAEDAFYNDIIDSWNEADVIPVFALGNTGPGCRSASSPGDQPNLISVGATDLNDLVATFSSHGPSSVALRIKPEVSAPGVNVRSVGIATDSAYSVLSGTSMATPHVAGAVALLIELGVTDRASIAELLESTAYRPDLETIVCTGGGVDPDDPWPNNSYGWGRIDVAAAVAEAVARKA